MIYLEATYEKFQKFKYVILFANAYICVCTIITVIVQ